MEWLSRSLVVSPYHIGLCLDPKKFEAEQDRLNIPPASRASFLGSPHSHATTHYFENGSGGLIALVCLGPSAERDELQVYALLVHEAVHVWQKIRECIGEKEPSAEFEAYSIQSITQELLFAYRALTTKPPRTKKR